MKHKNIFIHYILLYLLHFKLGANIVTGNRNKHVKNGSMKF